MYGFLANAWRRSSLVSAKPRPLGPQSHGPVMPLTQNVVFEVGLIAQLGAHVVVERGGVRGADGGHGRVEFRLRRRRGFVDAFEAAVEAAHGALIVAQQLFSKRLNGTRRLLLSI